MAKPPPWVDYATLLVAGGFIGYTLGALPDLSGRESRRVRRYRRNTYGTVLAPYQRIEDLARLPLDPDGYDPYGTHRT